MLHSAYCEFVMNIGQSECTMIKIDQLLRRELSIILARNGVAIKSRFPKPAVSRTKSDSLDMSGSEGRFTMRAGVWSGSKYA